MKKRADDGEYEDDGEDDDDGDDGHDVDDDNDDHDGDHDGPWHAPNLDGIEVQVSCPDPNEGQYTTKRADKESYGRGTGGIFGIKAFKNKSKKSISPPTPMQPRKPPLKEKPKTEVVYTSRSGHSPGPSSCPAASLQSESSNNPFKRDVIPNASLFEEPPVCTRRSTVSIPDLTAQMTKPLSHTCRP